ncbi:MAG: hypothetical protein LQ338_002928 [Usnochroma carphineum]|nr:MAG: hypothetical protein LQ338_002928 [Usnochroma carphineum]
MHFPSLAALNDHYRATHNLRFCRGCKKYYRNVDRESQRHKRRCFGPKGYGPDASDSESESESESESDSEEGEGFRQKESFKSYKNEDSKTNEKARPGDKDLPKSIPNLYGLLRVHPFSTQEQIARAARKRRIEVHPDKLKKPGMTDLELGKIDETAMEIGYAADLLLDPEKRAKYDRERRERKRQDLKETWGDTRAT